MESIGKIVSAIRAFSVKDGIDRSRRYSDEAIFSFFNTQALSVVERLAKSGKGKSEYMSKTVYSVPLHSGYTHTISCLPVGCEAMVSDEITSPIEIDGYPAATIYKADMSTIAFIIPTKKGIQAAKEDPIMSCYPLAFFFNNRLVLINSKARRVIVSGVFADVSKFTDICSNGDDDTPCTDMRDIIVPFSAEVVSIAKDEVLRRLGWFKPIEDRTLNYNQNA